MPCSSWVLTASAYTSVTSSQAKHGITDLRLVMLNIWALVIFYWKGGCHHLQIFLFKCNIVLQALCFQHQCFVLSIIVFHPTINAAAGRLVITINPVSATVWMSAVLLIRIRSLSQESSFDGTKLQMGGLGERWQTLLFTELLFMQLCKSGGGDGFFLTYENFFKNARQFILCLRFFFLNGELAHAY